MNISSKRIQVGEDEGFVASDQVQYLLYFPLRRSVFHISQAASRILTDETENKTEQNDLLSRINQTIVLRRKQTIEAVPESDRAHNVLGLALTSACNLRCLYCHANAGETNRFMSEQLMHDAIEYVFQWCQERHKGLYLVFTGSGEPTVHWNGLTQALEHAQELCKSISLPFHVNMSTNGMYGDNKRQYVIEHFSRVSLSLDGPKHIHDQNRVRVSGDGSFEMVFATAKYFFRHQFPFQIRATVSKQNAAHMLETYEFFQSEFPGTRVAFEPLNPIGRGKNLNQIPTEDEFAAGYLSIMDCHDNHTLSYSAISSVSQLRDRFCSPVATPDFNVAVDGRIHSCSRSGVASTFSFGTYDKQSRRFLLDREAMERLSRISVDDFPECKSCFARYNCAGDCHDLRDAGFRRCKINRALLWRHLQRAIKKEAN